MTCKKFAFITDIHWGYQRTNSRHKVPVHNPRALEAVLKFISDFQPDYLTLGGDQLDLRVISHWTKKSKLSMEGLRLHDDFVSFRHKFLEPLTQSLPTHCVKRVHKGNHEDWLDQFLDENPALEGLLSIDQHIGYSALGWENIGQGKASKIGKLHFVHGEHITGTNVAKMAVEMYEASVRFGHFHTYQAYTKTSVLDATQCKTGIAVPSLCSRAASYGKGAPNRWLTGFNAGYVFPDGTYTDTVIVMVQNRFAWNGTVYAG